MSHAKRGRRHRTEKSTKAGVLLLQSVERSFSQHLSDGQAVGSRDPWNLRFPSGFDRPGGVGSEQGDQQRGRFRQKTLGQIAAGQVFFR